MGSEREIFGGRRRLECAANENSSRMSWGKGCQPGLKGGKASQLTRSKAWVFAKDISKSIDQVVAELYQFLIRRKRHFAEEILFLEIKSTCTE